MAAQASRRSVHPTALTLKASVLYSSMRAHPIRLLSRRTTDAGPPKEQKDDEAKKAYCEKEIGAAESPLRAPQSAMLATARVSILGLRVCHGLFVRDPDAAEASLSRAALRPSAYDPHGTSAWGPADGPTAA